MVMKKNWKNRSGVSPVIATILMVAITVVLAAVLYVMVMGFGGPSSNAPTGAFTKTEKTSATTITYTFGAMSKDTKFTDCKFTYAVAGGALQAAAPIQGTGASHTMTTGTSPVYTVTFVDLGNDGKISTGDYVTISTSDVKLASSAYTATLLFNDGSQICTSTYTV